MPKGIYKRKEYVKKVFINCKYCNKKVKCYPSMIKQFCNKECNDKYRIGKKCPNISKGLKKAHKRKSFGYKKGELIGEKNYAKKPETRKKISEKAKGKNNYFYDKHFLKELNANWQDGRSFEKYGFNWTETLRKSIRQRDNYKCQICNKYGNTIHHIDYNKKNNNINNLICLCKKCHSKTGKKKDRKDWTNYFNKLMRLRNEK